MRTFIRLFLLTLVFAPALVAEKAPLFPRESPVRAVRASSYRLSPRDLIRVAVFNEADMTSDRRIDATGSVSLPLIGNVNLERLTIAGAQEKIRDLYIQKEVFVQPQVSVTVVEYDSKEVSVIGQVKNPGRVLLPIEANELDIVDVISRAGGVTRIARSDSVRVTRKTPNGAEQSFTIDVERMFNGRGGIPAFMVQPGDVIFVPERVL